jgi:F-type H+-transporting ATPase subunit delta
MAYLVAGGIGMAAASGGDRVRGASRASLAAASQRLTETAEAGRADRLGDELFAVSGLLDREPALTRLLSDPARPGQARERLARGLLDGKIAPETLDIVAGLARAHWSEPGDLPDAAEQLAVTAIVIGADRAGQLDNLEDELFRFGRIIAAQPELRMALSSLFGAVEAKERLVGDLLTGRVTEATMRLVSQAVRYPRGRNLDVTLAEYARLAAQRRQRMVAEVHVAVDLSQQERERLAAALSQRYGHEVHLNVVIDEHVAGGLSVRVGDELIDGTIVSRLSMLRRRLAA